MGCLYFNKDHGKSSEMPRECFGLHKRNFNIKVFEFGQGVLYLDGARKKRKENFYYFLRLLLLLLLILKKWLTGVCESNDLEVCVKKNYSNVQY